MCYSVKCHIVTSLDLQKLSIRNPAKIGYNKEGTPPLENGRGAGVISNPFFKKKKIKYDFGNCHSGYMGFRFKVWLKGLWRCKMVMIRGFG